MVVERSIDQYYTVLTILCSSTIRFQARQVLDQASPLAATNPIVDAPRPSASAYCKLHSMQRKKPHSSTLEDCFSNVSFEQLNITLNSTALSRPATMLRGKSLALYIPYYNILKHIYHTMPHQASIKPAFPIRIYKVVKIRKQSANQNLCLVFALHNVLF